VVVGEWFGLQSGVKESQPPEATRYGQAPTVVKDDIHCPIIIYLLLN
jgi:hypothetical protein